MTDNHRIPRNSELMPIGKKGNANVRAFIEMALNSEEVMNDIEPYKTNDGVTGNAKLDTFHAFLVVLAYDAKHGNGIKASGVKEGRAYADFNVVMRNRYELDPKGKVIGPNRRRYTLLAHSA
jgi:hypothetical protein